MNKANGTQRFVVFFGAVFFVATCVVPPVQTRFLGIPLEFLGLKWAPLWMLSGFSWINLPLLIVEWALIAGVTFGLFVMSADGRESRHRRSYRQPPRPRKPSGDIENPYMPPGAGDPFSDDPY